jgi:hypothetical protein
VYLSGSTVNVNGLGHEFGHSNGLGHRTDVSVMNTNWQYNVQFTDALAVKEYYNK